MLGVGFIGLSLSARRGGTVLLSTLSFTYAQMSPSLTGQLGNNTPFAGQTGLIAELSVLRPSWWAGVITGTGATISMLQNGTDTPAGMVQVSVAGGAFTAAPVVSGKYQLFTGLSHAARVVIIRINQGYANTASIPNSGNVMTVTGAPPSITVYNHVQPLDANAFALSPCMPEATPNTGYLPANVIYQAAAGAANVPSTAFRRDITELLVTTRSRYSYVSVNGAAPTRYDVGTETLNAVRIAGLSGLKTYNVWCGNSTGYQTMSVGTLGGTDVAHGLAGLLDQYGDSITEGVTPSTSQGESDIFGVAAALNRVGGNFGIAGHTIADLKNRLAAVFANKTVTSADVAVVAIGRNNPGALFDATAEADYTSIINSLLATSYGRIICRGILPDGVNTWATENAKIAARVSAAASSRVVFCDTSSWSGITTGGATHPGDAGYAVLRGYCIANYPALIAAPAFTPASLYTGGFLGGYYDASVLTSVWQDTSAADPATVNGRVRRINDLSGNGKHLIGEGVLRQAGALYYIETDGSFDFYDATISITTSTLTAWFAGRTITDAGGARLWSAAGTGLDFDNASNAAAIMTKTGGFRAFRNSTSLSEYTVAAGTNVMIQSRFNGTDHVMRGNGVNQTAVASTGAFNFTKVSLAARADGGGALLNAGFYTMGLINRVLTAGEQVSLDTWAGAKAGLTL